MKIKIIKNNFEGNEDFESISQYIGKEYTVTEKDFFDYDREGGLKGVDIDEIDIQVYEGEYEIIG